MKSVITLAFISILCSFQPAPQQQNYCESYEYGSVRIVNKTKYDIEGRICLRNVDKRSGKISPLFCRDFSIAVGGEMIYREMLEGNAAYSFGVLKPDPNNFTNTIASDTKSGNTYIERCKTVDLVLQ